MSKGFVNPRETWDARFAREDYIFGLAPNVFLTQQAQHLAAGMRALAVADGEGRNSVWLAQRGLDVVAFDIAPLGVAKARRLAERCGVQLDYRVASVEAWDWTPEAFDVVAAIFVQFAAPAVRAQMFEGMLTTLRPGRLAAAAGLNAAPARVPHRRAAVRRASVHARTAARGRSEQIMGEALASRGWPRSRYVVSTKFYWGLAQGKGEFPHERNTLNRKYLLGAIDGSLARLQLDHVDLVYCHRPDPDTPIEETVWAMYDLIARGKALYWGTSEWPADAIRAAYEVADRHHLHKPLMEQAQYNLFHRKRVEQEYARLYAELGLGLTTWSPLASGLLTGKYRQGMPPGSRGTVESYAFLRERLINAEKNRIVGELEAVAHDLGCTLARLALAWCLANPNVDTVITGATRVAQIEENMKALEVEPKLDTEAMQRIDAIVGAGYH